MSSESEFKNSFMYTMHSMTVRDKIIWVLQIVFPIAILIIGALGLNDVVPIYTTNTIDLILLIILFIICGVKFIPERKLYSFVYFFIAALMCVILIASFII